jgi:hypothetical protein
VIPIIPQKRENICVYGNNKIENKLLITKEFLTSQKSAWDSDDKKI